MSALLSVDRVVKHFPVRGGVLRRVVAHVRAVDGVSVEVNAGETLGLVGESGSGKSTLGRLMVRLLDPTSGSITLEGTELATLPEKKLRPLRRQMQIVFQDPYSSMDPLATIADSLSEPMRTHLALNSKERDEQVAHLLETVGLTAAHRHRYPREFSGGQLQRVAIARALALQPRLLVLDEPVSSLDVSIQADIINLLERLQNEFALTFVFIAHDLAVVRHVSDRIAVMYLGRIVEDGPAELLYNQPKHPYTEALLSAIPVPHPARQRSRRRIVLEGDIPSPLAPPPGCRFHTRCPYTMDICRHEDPEAIRTPDGTTVFCHLHTSGPVLAGETVLSIRPTAKQVTAPTMS